MNASCTCLTNALAEAVMPAGFCAFEIPVSIDRARSVLSLPGGPNLLALERGTQSVVLFEDTDNDGIPDTKRSVATAANLNHGMALFEGFLYASSDTTVYRWPWDDATLSVTGDSTVVINNINADGNGGAPQGHKTRTLEFDSLGRLYVSVGSNGNVDPDSFRSRIRRFDIANTAFPIDFLTGQVYADGLRNAVAMAHDRNGTLWAADTGADNLQRDDLGGDITDDNPAEELMKIRQEGLHYGYPYCWTEYRLDEPYAKGRGTAYAWPTFLDSGNVTGQDFLDSGNVTDQDCRTIYDQADVAMQAHSTPLGITFYNYKPPEALPDYCPGGAFPESMDGYVFVAFHGSWNRRIPTGYKLVYVEVDKVTGNATSEPMDLLAHVPPNARWSSGFRPVDVDFDDCGRLLLSSDGTGGRGAMIVRVESIGEQCNVVPPSSSAPSAAPSNAPSIVRQSSPTTGPPVTLPTAAADTQPPSIAPITTTTTTEPSCVPSGSPTTEPTSSATQRKVLLVSTLGLVLLSNLIL